MELLSPGVSHKRIPIKEFCRASKQYSGGVYSTSQPNPRAASSFARKQGCELCLRSKPSRLLVSPFPTEPSAFFWKRAGLAESEKLATAKSRSPSELILTWGSLFFNAGSKGRKESLKPILTTRDSYAYKKPMKCDRVYLVPTYLFVHVPVSNIIVDLNQAYVSVLEKALLE